MKKITLILPFILLLVTGTYFYYKFTESAESIADRQAEYTLSASKIFNEFDLIESSATAKYKNKVVEVVGRVKDVSRNEKGDMVIDLASENTTFSVKCYLAPSQSPYLNEIQKEEEITIKGICKGMLLDVVFEDCVID